MFRKYKYYDEMPFWRIPLKYLSILLIKYLQYKYKDITINSEGKQSNQVLAKLKFIQHTLYFFKNQFRAWGYFHPGCVWSEKDEKFFRKLFPQKDDSFKEIDIVVWHNPEAVTYYHNKIYVLSNGSLDYAKEIKIQLKKWKDWN